MSKSQHTTNYQHKHEATQRPDVGVQDHFTTKKPPWTYRFDSSLDPSLNWDENRDHDLAKWLIGLVRRCATEGEAVVFAAPQVWAGGGVQVQSLKAAEDLLETSRASEIFSVTALPDAVLRKVGKKNDDGAALYEVKLLGLDIFDPATMEQEAIEGQNMPAWMLDTDYDGLSFYGTFPKTAASDNLQKSLKAEFDPSVWAHLAGTVSEPFTVGPKQRVAVKVIDERGNELMRVLEVKA
ncbi:hypothetical protein ACEN9J_08915 [Variovorax sp. Varisp41]|uniref:hypothetical protein n=1 Tax=Variovorax sp. Varisp41 TaxID=3243033 RepID=UPI0039B4E038